MSFPIKLSEIVKWKPGKTFFFRGKLAELLWTESVVEEVGVFGHGDQKPEMKYAHHNAFAFHYEGGSVTFRSMWPHPDKVLVEDITL